MKTISLDFNYIKSYADFYAVLGSKLAFPSYFGKNLDALYDFLTGGMEMPLKIEFKNCNRFKRNAFSRLIGVMKDVQQELTGFEFELIEE